MVDVSAPSVVTLAEIDLLIKDTNYDKALAELARYEKMNPVYFDEAQKRVQKILNARNKYIAIADQLITVIKSDPGNDKKILDIIAQLEALEKHPSDKQLVFISNAKIAAQFNYYRSQFLEIQNKAAVLFLSGDYVGAVTMNRAGFYMYQEEFFDQYTDPMIVNSVKKALSSVDVELESYKNIQQRLDNACNAFIAAVKMGDSEVAEKRFGEVKEVCSEYAVIRNRFCAAGWELQRIFTLIKIQNPDITDASFLPFVSRLILGRTGNPDSGIEGAVDGEWNILIEKMKRIVADAIADQHASFEKAAAGSFFALPKASVLQLSTASRFAALGIGINDLYTLFKTSESGKNIEEYPLYKVSLAYASGLSMQTVEAVNSATVLQQEKMHIDGYQMPENPSQAELNGFSYISDILAIASTMEQTALKNAASYENEPWAAEYQSALEKEISENTATGIENESVNGKLVHTTAGVQISDSIIKWETLERSYRNGTKLSSVFASDTVSKLWQNVGTYYVSCGTSYVETCTNKFEKAHMLFSGIPLESDKNLIGKYPQEAFDNAQILLKETATDKVILIKARTLLSGSAYKNVNTEAFDSIGTSIQKLNDLDDVTTKLLADAKEQIQLAKRIRNEADLRYSQAQTALASSGFDVARKRLQEARTKYNESLSYQESTSLRSTSDEQLEKLGNEIVQRENEVVVVDVRRLKTQAKSAYYNGNFENAENLLNQAKTRWAVTNIDEDTEITNLLAFVSTALSMKTGRIIPPSAPLYPEMSQLLSIASAYYEDGQSLVRAGKKDEGKAELEKALQKLQELQLVYPLNQDASLLTLRIHQILDPADFGIMFASKVTNARDSYNDPLKQKTAYADLLDLYEINPNYPGLKKLIYDIEIAIGVRRKPVDNTALTKSNTLTVDAQVIVNNAGRDEMKFRQALVKVDEAISLNPDNDAAMLLKDKIQMIVGGKAAVVLTSEDETKYQQAIQEMQKNNIITANSLVEQLLQKPANRRSSKLLELQKKIKALL